MTINYEGKDSYEKLQEILWATLDYFGYSCSEISIIVGEETISLYVRVRQSSKCVNCDLHHYYLRNKLIPKEDIKGVAPKYMVLRHFGIKQSEVYFNERLRDGQ